MIFAFYFLNNKQYMLVEGKNFETIWIKANDKKVIQVIDQRNLPFRFEVVDLKTPDDVYYAIKEMIVRGAPLIGATAAFGIYLATLQLKEIKNSDKELEKASEYLKSSRPTAINLAFAIDEVLDKTRNVKSVKELQDIAFEVSKQRLEKEREYCKRIGEHGFRIIEEISKQKKGETINILTHCNAGWLACIDYGTATAPIYLAHERGIPVHVWVDETRPRNQGSKLTAWELEQQGVPNTIIADNTGGHLMQHGMVDLCIVGSDRTTKTGDVANKIGTYLKALAAKDNKVPFYVALPSSSFDFGLSDGVQEIPIELRDSKEITHIDGMLENSLEEVQIVHNFNKVANYGFDVTPARLVTGLITERGICDATERAIGEMFSDLI